MSKVSANLTAVRYPKQFSTLAKIDTPHSPELNKDRQRIKRILESPMKTPLDNLGITRHGSQRECKYITVNKPAQIIAARRNEIGLMISPRRFVTLQDKLEEFSSRGINQTAPCSDIYANKVVTESTMAATTNGQNSPNIKKVKNPTLSTLTKALQVKALYSKGACNRKSIIEVTSPEGSKGNLDVGIRSRANTGLSSNLSAKVTNLIQERHQKLGNFSPSASPNQFKESNITRKQTIASKGMSPSARNDIKSEQMKSATILPQTGIQTIVYNPEYDTNKDNGSIKKLQPSKLQLKNLIGQSQKASLAGFQEPDSRRNKIDSLSGVLASDGKSSSRFNEETTEEMITLENGLKVMSKRVGKKKPKLSVFTTNSGAKSLAQQTPSNMISKTSFKSSKDRRVCLVEIFKRRDPDGIEDKNSSSDSISHPESRSSSLVPKLALGSLVINAQLDNTLMLVPEISFLGQEDLASSRKTIRDVLDHM